MALGRRHGEAGTWLNGRIALCLGVVPFNNGRLGSSSGKWNGQDRSTCFLFLIS
ncbi:hypothetical protein RchiOBHm_Chr7g0219401 [Rosa chinensis]|uniref:Uncharacterized protein n=1 Tax=Rosa chinensis TaxID=74649 RepID=A0A2P6PCI0_ROSCH|nr:hypothetical protein RchiOBHm_Chr7g0219401 [Rosa chinensis]